MLSATSVHLHVRIHVSNLVPLAPCSLYSEWRKQTAMKYAAGIPGRRAKNDLCGRQQKTTNNKIQKTNYEQQQQEQEQQ